MIDLASISIHRSWIVVSDGGHGTLLARWWKVTGFSHLPLWWEITPKAVFRLQHSSEMMLANRMSSWSRKREKTLASAPRGVNYGKLYQSFIRPSPHPKRRN